MPKQIIVLEKTEAGRFKYAFWAQVPPGRQSFYAGRQTESVWKGASAQENTDIANGVVVEKVDELALDGLTIQQAQTALVSLFSEFQSKINSFNPWNRYGSYYDGTSWTAGGAT